MFDEKRYVGRTLTQRRSIDRHYGNSIEKVFPEFAGRDLLVKVAIRSCNYADINRDFVVAANGSDCPLLQNAQELDLAGG